MEPGTANLPLMEALCVGPLASQHRPLALRALGIPDNAWIHFQGGLKDPAELPGMSARCEDRLLGVTLYTIEDKSIRFLRTAAVSAPVLKALLTCGERQALRQGCRTAHIYLTQSAPQLVKAYKECGYRIVALYPASVAGHLGAEHGQDVLELEKPLQKVRQFAV